MFSSCTKSNDIDENKSLLNTKADEKIVTFAKSLAIALESKEIRELLKNNTLYEYFKEPYVLFANVAKQPLVNGDIYQRSNGNTLLEVLNNIVGLDTTNNTYFDDLFIEENPLLTMYIIPSGTDETYSPSSWNINIDDAIVITDPFSDDAFQKAYDSDLTEYFVSEENLESLNKTAILVYNTAELIAVDIDNETLVDGSTISELLISRGINCIHFPSGLEELCESFRMQLAEIAVSAPKYSDESFNMYIMATERLLALFLETCCSGGTQGGGNQYVSCLEDSGNGFCRDSRTFREELTRIRIQNPVRRSFAKYKRSFTVSIHPVHRVLNNLDEVVLSQQNPWFLALTRSKHSKRETFDLIERGKVLRGVLWDYCRSAENIEYRFIGINPDAGTVITNTYTHHSGKINATVPVPNTGATVGYTFPTSTESYNIVGTIRNVELGSTNVVYSDNCGTSQEDRGSMHFAGGIWFWIREGWSN